MRYDIYFDMDGVLTDMDDFLARAAPDPLTKERRDALLKSLFGSDLFAGLGTNRLGFFREKMRELAGLGHGVQILTSYGSHGTPTDFGVTSHVGKATWLRRNYGDLFEDGTIVRFNGTMICDQKQVYATPNAIMIDDQEDNVVQWRARGGLAVHYHADRHDECIRELDAILAGG